MASEKDKEKPSELLGKSKISESPLKLPQQEADLRKDARISVSLPFMSSSGYAPSGNQDPTNQELVSDGVYQPTASTFGYFARSNGLSSNLENQVCISTHEALKPSYSVYHPAGQVISLNKQRLGQFCPVQGVGSFRSSSQMLIDNSGDQITRKFYRNRGFGVCSELTRGPRANRKSGVLTPASTGNSIGLFIRRDNYNLEDFQVTYEKAKFFMIKSFSEDDIHKSIKYNVWSSTISGNKKLDTAFREAEAKTNESAMCPIFLFFSVNTSGQFVGLAQMVGYVDFSRSMDFWQQDKWRGFFPVKWHIIKDIPNSLFLNIILENNDNRTVTYSRDTQEIGLPQGLKMLQIFKSFQAKTSILDDFDFYEVKQKSLQSQRSSREVTKCGDNFLGYPRSGRMDFTERSDQATTFHKASLVTLTKNLSLNSHGAK